MKMWLALPMVVLALMGCAKKSAMAPSDEESVSGVVNLDGMLAYEHSVAIELAEPLIPGRMAALREACLTRQHGPCSLLEYTESSGSYDAGRMQVRSAPEVVEPLVAMASEHGTTGSRTTRAEDLSAAVADNAQDRDSIAVQQRRLEALSTRGDLSVSDHLQLTRELANLEAQRLAAERIAAQHQIRLESNLLTIEFRAQREEPPRSARLMNAFSDASDGFLDGLTEAIETAAFALPFLLLAFPLALLWRSTWRWATRARGKTEG